MNFRYRLMQFMRGRYGPDAFFHFLVIIASILAVVNIFVRSFWLQVAGVNAIIAYAFFRMLSRNLEARSRENRFFLNVKTALFKNHNIRRQRRADRTHVYKKCPQCRAVLRLPRRKGKHTTICPKCGNKFKVHVFKA